MNLDIGRESMDIVDIAAVIDLTSHARPVLELLPFKVKDVTVQQGVGYLKIVLVVFLMDRKEPFIGLHTGSDHVFVRTDRRRRLFGTIRTFLSGVGRPGFLVVRPRRPLLCMAISSQ